MATLTSVCLPSYNGAKYIAQQIESILCSPLVGEVLISDDGSSDRTLEIVNSFSDPRIRLMQGPRAGLIRNYGFLLSEAAGEHIFLSDQDDVWLDCKTEVMLDALSTSDLVVSDCIVVDEALEVLHPSFFVLNHSGPGLLRNLMKNSYLGCCMAFNRSLLQRVLPFPPRLPMHDWWIGLVAEMTGTVSFVPRPLVQYRRHGANASSTSARSAAPFAQRLAWRTSLVQDLILRATGR